MRKIILFFLMIILVPACLFAQERTITGTVTDVSGSLPGATIFEKGMPKNITTTNTYGKFALTLKGKTNVIIVRFVGYAAQEIPLGNKKDVTVVMQPSANSITEVTVVGFQPTKRITSTGAVSTINASEINTVPTSSVQNTLAGRLPGFTSVQVSGQPGNDASTFYIRGQSSLNTSNQPLILVDDIEYDYSQLQQINVNEIETISLLKDAAETAIYGIKGANGVLLVTTKRGKSGSPKFDLRLEGGLQTATITPKFLDSYQSAQLVNQAYINAGDTSLPFSQADLLAYKTGSDPYGHPNTNWYNDIVRKYTYQANTNLDISGGTDQVKYFISFGAFNQNGDLRNFPDPEELVNTNYYYTRYDFRSNLDLRANKTLTLRLDVTTRFGDINAPGTSSSATNVLYNFQVEDPFSAPFLNPNGSYAYNNSIFTTGHTPTLNALLANGGYSHTHNTDYNVLVSATQNLDAITPGLSLTGRIAYASSESDNKGTNFLQLSLASETSAFPTYYYNSATHTYTKNPLGPYVYATHTYFGGINSYSNTTNVQLFSNYDRTIGDNHFTGLLLLNQDSQAQQSNIGDNLRGFSLRAGYDFKQKYLIDFNMAYNGTNAFAAGHQYGLFPAVGVGYVLSKEHFFKDLFSSDVFSLFKIRGSYGVVGSDLVPSSGYIFQQTYGQAAGTYTFGTAGNILPYSGVTEGGLANPYITWERSRKADLGFDINMFNDRLSATIDLFDENRYNEFVVPQGIPAQLGVSPPYINSGRVQNRGFDGQIGYHGSIGAVQYNTNFVFSYARNKILYEAQATPAYTSLSPIGKPIGQPFGYHFLGYYTQADINAVTTYINQHGNNAGDPIPVPDYADSPTGVKKLLAGDLKYADINGHDGVANIYDQEAIGNPNIPSTTLGLTIGASYKGFSVSVLFQGSFDYSYIINGTGIEPFESEFQPIHQEAWTPATAATAKFPIITPDFSSTINSPKTYPSDYWYVNAYYIRLKSLDIGYQLPTRLLPFHLRNARIYVSAYNLVTWDNFSRFQQDPEVQSGSVGDAYINQRVVNLGLQLGF